MGVQKSNVNRLDTSRYVCKASGENTDVCFNVILENGTKENRCIEEREYNGLVEFDKKTNGEAAVVGAKITNESLSSDKETILTIVPIGVYYTVRFS